MFAMDTLRCAQEARDRFVFVFVYFILYLCTFVVFCSLNGNKNVIEVVQVWRSFVRRDLSLLPAV